MCTCHGFINFAEITSVTRSAALIPFFAAFQPAGCGRSFVVLLRSLLLPTLLPLRGDTHRRDLYLLKFVVFDDKIIIKSRPFCLFYFRKHQFTVPNDKLKSAGGKQRNRVECECILISTKQIKLINCRNSKMFFISRFKRVSLGERRSKNIRRQ